MTIDGLEKWLEALWRDTEGYVLLATKNSEGDWKQGFAQWPKSKPNIIDYILRQSSQGNETYCGPAKFKEKKLNKDSFLESWVLWADFDGNAPETWPSAPADAATGTTGTVPAPSVRVRSSTPGNQHVYWMLDKPITDPDKLQNINRTLALELGSDISVWNISRVLRPPETTNYGHGKPDRNEKYPVIIEESTSVRYSPDTFKETSDFRPLLKSSLGEIPPIQKVLATKTWHDDFYNLFSDTVTPRQDGKGRSYALMRLAYYGAEAGFTPEEIYAVLQDADDRWGKYKNRNDREQRFADFIDRAISKHPRGLNEYTFSGLTGAAVPVTTDTAIEIKSHYALDDFMSTEIHIDWIFEGLLSVGGYGIIAGEPGVGKTQLSIRFMEALATGMGFLGQWKNSGRARKVLFLSLEMSFPEIQKFFKDMGPGYAGGFRQNVHIAPIGDVLPLDTEEGRKYFEKLLNEVQPEVIVIDSMAKAMHGNFKEDDVARLFNNYLVKIRHQTQAAIVIVHHNRKSQDKRSLANELDDLYGSRFLSQDAQFVLMLYRNPKEPAWKFLSTAKIRFGPEHEPLRLEHTDNLDFIAQGEISDDNDQFTGRGLGLFFSGESS